MKPTLISRNLANAYFANILRVVLTDGNNQDCLHHFHYNAYDTLPITLLGYRH